MAAKQGLYANIQAKRKRIAKGSGEKMRKPGEEGAPAPEAFRKAAKTANKATKKKAAAGSPTSEKTAARKPAARNTAAKKSTTKSSTKKSTTKKRAATKARRAA